MKRFNLTFTLSICLAGACAGKVSLAEDWPQFRGPRADGTWDVAGLPADWTTSKPKQIWKTAIGNGYGGVAVAKGQLYLMDRPQPSVKGMVPDGQERVLCLNAATGEKIWEHVYPAHYGEMDYGNGPRATPTIVDELVYTFGAAGQVCCLDAKSGKIHWQKDTVEHCGAKVPMWGFAASPVVVGKLVIVHCGAEPEGSVIAFDRFTGEQVWRNLSDPAGYCTPLLIESPSGPQLLVWTPENIHGLDPQTGERYWTIPYKVTYGVAIASPVYHQGIVFVTGYWEGSKAIRLGKTSTEAKLVWEENKNLRGLMAPPLGRDGFVYTIDKRFGLTCFDITTGEKRWDADNKLTPRDRNPQATFVWAGGDNKVVAFNSQGELVLARFLPDEYQEVSRTKILDPDPVTWANPAFAMGCVFAHNGKELVCVRLVE